MPSVKQIEAFYWSGMLGSFVAAADRLNTTQSNISKRIQELELTLGMAVFDRSRRAIRLTAKGEELMRASEIFLRAHSNLAGVGGKGLQPAGPFHLGVTEAVALAWLPRLCKMITAEFPDLVPITRVDTSSRLGEMIQNHKIDLIIGSRQRLNPDLTMVPLQTVERDWFVAPHIAPASGFLTIEELVRLPILGHGANGGSDATIVAQVGARGYTPQIVTSCNNLTALARMTEAGMGITYLHRGIFNREVEAGRLSVVRTEIDLPVLSYVAAHRNDQISQIAGVIAEIARKACDFS